MINNLYQQTLNDIADFSNKKMKTLNELFSNWKNEMNRLQNKVESLNESKIQLEKEKIKADSEIRWYMARTERDFKTSQVENDSKKIEIELAQIYDGNPYNDQVRTT